MTKEFELLMKYKKLTRDVRAIEDKLLELFAHPQVSDADMLEWRERYRELRRVHRAVVQRLRQKGVPV